MTMRRERFLAGLCAIAALAFLALLAARGILREPAGASAYAFLAEAFLQGRLYVENCPAIDCAVFAGRNYIVFPPLPALLLLPVVVVTGAAGFKGAVAIAMILAALALWVWRRIFAALDLDRTSTAWMLAALALSSPLYYAVLKADGVWFLAHALGFLMATLAIAAVIVWRNLPLAGVFVALGLLCRQMIVFYPLFLAMLALRPGETLLHPSRQTLRAAMLAALPLCAALLAVFAYNHARFGHVLEAGYVYISNGAGGSFLNTRADGIGLFSPQYILFNVYYLLVQGFHAEFAGPLRTQVSGVDWSGVSLLAACPWIALMFYTRLDRVAAGALASIGVIVLILLFYHSNGYAQLGAQRYTLDWLPIALVLIARSARPGAFRALPLLVTYAIVMNAVAIGTAMLVTAH